MRMQFVCEVVPLKLILNDNKRENEKMLFINV